MSTDPHEVWAQLLCNQAVGDYHMTRLIAGGGFGLVFEAEHSRSGKAVAIKVLPPTKPEATLEFASEGALLKQLHSSSRVVQLVESADQTIRLSGPAGLPVPISVRYHVLELASGCLEELVLNRESLCWADRLSLWRGVVLGVHQMHLNQIVHRDLKSANCLLFARGRGKVESKVADLGRARDLKVPSRLCAEDYIQGRGDLRFAPPEFLWLQGEDSAEGHRSADLYGLGSLLFELATGQCITALALGLGPTLRDEALKDVGSTRRVDLHTLRPRYELAHAVLWESTPAAIRHPTSKLIRQLCDPEPSCRFPAQRFGRRQPQPMALEWLLRQADILLKSLARAPKPRSAPLSRPGA